VSDADSTRERRLVFGEVAELYDRVRPSYPRDLIDDVVSFAELEAGSRLLESGAGTGKATTLFLDFLEPNDWHLVAVEPDPAMAAILSDHLAHAVASRRADVCVEGLEQFAASSPAPFDLLYAAQSWHWVSAERRAALAAALLRPGGTLALIWNVGSHPGTGVQQALDKVYEAHAPGVRFQPIQSAATGPAPQPKGLSREYSSELEATGAFSALEIAEREWSQTYDAETWTSLLQTHSDHRLLETDTLSRLLEAVAQVVDGFGGTITSHYRAVALLAKRLG